MFTITRNINICVQLPNTRIEVSNVDAGYIPISNHSYLVISVREDTLSPRETSLITIRCLTANNDAFHALTDTNIHVRVCGVL